MRLEIISSYNQWVWYAKLVGKTFSIVEVDKAGNARIDNGNKVNSCWVEKADYKIL